MGYAFRSPLGSKWVLAAAAGSFLLAARPTQAQDNNPSGVQVELGVAGGVHLFAKDLELGVADDPGLTTPKNSGLFGARAALAFNPILSLEVEGVGIPGGDRVHNYREFIVGWRAHVLAHVMPGQILNGKLRPFVLAGAGALSVVSTQGTDYNEIKKDTDFAFHVGAGVKYALNSLIGLRLDARALAVPNTSDNGLSPDFEFMGGLTFTLGGHEAPPPPPPPPAPPKDSDGDGILDANDKCPNAAEDKDGFEDEDGCPDLDNDKDGIPDATDKCPNEPETKNGIDDEDGCPEKDTDGDGILGSRDKCPDEAEDKDGFEDEDGCPDLDNDKDGIPDATDKCPNEPETKNGFQDDDGCPDELPAEVAKFTGVIEGISFRKNSAVIKPASFKTLKEAIKVLQAYPALRIEIAGHTSDEGKREFNMKLSERRAEAAKAYLVKGGVDASRIIAVGYGPDKPIADNKTKKGQEKNRRIEFHLITDQPAGTPAASPSTIPPVPPADPKP
jgi:outer membrane protein OmpA-like peptidoglycan-associated protein/opacity protein-like surface antigen